jgi:hypothetical protein
MQEAKYQHATFEVLKKSDVTKTYDSDFIPTLSLIRKNGEMLERIGLEPKIKLRIVCIPLILYITHRENLFSVA